MDNSRFNQTFNVYAKDSLELFKVFTPAYMEKIINIADRMGIGMLSIRGNCVEVIFDSNFPVLKNPSIGYNVPQALSDAEGIFQYFMYFMEFVSCIGIN